MKTVSIALGVVVLFVGIMACSNTKPESLWRRHCEACHDGKTVLNGEVLLNREEMKGKYRGKALNDFVDACRGSSTCMNILKHQENLLRQVGEEMGIGAKP